MNFTGIESERGKFFFWLGMLILPVFWVWWMTEKNFTRTQIKWSKWWTCLYVALGLFAWFALPVFREKLLELQWSYPHIAFQIGIALWVWLAIRMAWPFGIVELILLVNVVGVLATQIYSQYLNLVTEPPSIFYVLVPIVFHLLCPSSAKDGER